MRKFTSIEKDGISSEQHFDWLAKDYDKHKQQNSYYYKNLKKIPLIYFKNPQKLRVLEIGCGTGQILADFNPKYGIGVDISKNMIALANKKHNKKNLRFMVDNIENSKLNEGKFDVVIMTDVVEHLNDFEKAAQNIKKYVRRGGSILITTANPLWSPILEIAEKLNFKMEEGPHTWTLQRKITKVLKEYGFKIIATDTYLLIPIHIPFLSEPINHFFRHIPILNKWGLIQAVVAN